VYPPRWATNPNQAPAARLSRGVAYPQREEQGTKQTKASGPDAEAVRRRIEHADKVGSAGNAVDACLKAGWRYTPCYRRGVAVLLNQLPICASGWSCRSRSSTGCAAGRLLRRWRWSVPHRPTTRARLRDAPAAPQVTLLDLELIQFLEQLEPCRAGSRGRGAGADRRLGLPSRDRGTEAYQIEAGLDLRRACSRRVGPGRANRIRRGRSSASSPTAAPCRLLRRAAGRNSPLSHRSFPGPLPGRRG